MSMTWIWEIFRPVKQRPHRTPLEGEEKNIFKNFWMQVLFTGVLTVGVPYSVGSEEEWHCQILY